MADDVPSPSPADRRPAHTRAFEELERGIHVAFEDQVQSVPADALPAWPDWMETNRQNQLAGGGAA